MRRAFFMLFCFFIFVIMKIYFLSVLVLVLSSCEKAKFPSEYSKQLLGAWEWESSSLQSQNWTDTPENTGETRQLEFKENGKYLEFVNKKRVLKGDYYIISETQSLFLELHLEHSNADNILVRIDGNGPGTLSLNSYIRSNMDLGDYVQYIRIK